MADQNALIPAATAKLNEGKACLKAVRTVALIIARMPGHPVRASVNAVIRVAASVIRGDGREIHFTPEWLIKRL